MFIWSPVCWTYRLKQWSIIHTLRSWVFSCMQYLDFLMVSNNPILIYNLCYYHHTSRWLVFSRMENFNQILTNTLTDICIGTHLWKACKAIRTNIRMLQQGKKNPAYGRHWISRLMQIVEHKQWYLGKTSKMKRPSTSQSLCGLRQNSPN